MSMSLRMALVSASYDRRLVGGEKIASNPPFRSVFESDLVPMLVSGEDPNLATGINFGYPDGAAAGSLADDSLGLDDRRVLRLDHRDSSQLIDKCVLERDPDHRAGMGMRPRDLRIQALHRCWRHVEHVRDSF